MRSYNYKIIKFRGLTIYLEQEAGYAGKNIQILNFPASNFNLQEPGTNDELLDGIRHVRPGEGYIPHEQTHFFSKSDVNGDNENDIYKILKVSELLSSILYTFLKIKITLSIKILNFFLKTKLSKTNQLFEYTSQCK